MEKARVKMAEVVFCAGLVLAAFCLQPALAANIQVNPGGSITNAMAAANPGDTVHVSPGTYNENVAIDKSGTSGAYITLIADGAVVINAGGAGKAIRVAANYIIVSGFECTNFLEGINLRTAHIKILNCNVHSGTSMSNPVAGSNGMTVNFNTAIDDIDLENSNFYFNDAGGADLGCNASTDVLSNILIKNCKFYANNNVGGTDGIGIGHQGTKTNISLIKCEAYDNLSDGFDLDAPVYMNGCIAHDNDKIGGPNWGVGIKVWGHSGNPSVYGQVRLYNCLSYNNTQETDGGGGINIGGVNSIVANCLVAGNTSYGGLIISSGASITVQNTIFYNEHYSISSDSDTSHLTFDASNIIYNCQSNGALSAAAAALAKTFDPQFVNPVDNDVAPWGNFHLQSASRAINAGVNITGLVDDADGNIRPSGGSFDIGPYEFQSGTTPTPPSITTQPANQTVTAGQTATFSVIAAGTGPLSYQWTRNGTNISGATGTSYTTPATTVSDSGAVYKVVVSNSVGSVTSNGATLTVNAAPTPPTITTQPANQTVTAGQVATFSVVATGTATLSYQWTRNGTNISGATGTSYTTPATTVSDSGAVFKVIVSNGVGSATSNGATLTVNAAPTPPTISTQPSNQTVTAGQTATFSVVAAGTAPLSYQWTRNGTNIPGATSAFYTTPATTVSDSGAVFKVVVSNVVGSATSNGATLTVAASSTLINGSFETPSVGSASYTYNPSGAAWTFTGSSGIQSNGSAWGATNAPDGVQTAFLQSNGPLGAISQDVSLSAGTYTLSFQAAQRSYGSGVQPIRVSVDGAQIGSLFTPSSTAFASYTTATFTISAGIHTLKFEATDASGDRSSFVDSVSLTRVNTAPPAIANGSFETPSVGSASYQYNPIGGNWVFSGNSGIQSNGSAWGAAPATDGVQTAFLQGNPGQGAGAIGNISQSVSFSQTGTFAISFSAARRSGQIQPVRVTVDGTQVGALITPASNAFATYTSAAFAINTIGNHTIALAATNNSGDRSAMIDSVTISATTRIASLAADTVATTTMTSSPTAVPNPATTGQAITFTAAASGPDGDSLTYAWDFGDGASGFDASTTHTYSAAGTYAVSVIVSDSQGGSAEGTVSISVTPGAAPLNISKLTGRVRFDVIGHDAVAIQGDLDIPASFSPLGKMVTADVNGAQVAFQLDAKGRGKSAHGAVALQLKSTSNKSITASNVPFSLTFKNATLANTLGINPEMNARNASLNLAVSLVIGSNVYSSSITVKSSVKAHVSATFKK